jgi:hypothetical protein
MGQGESMAGKLLIALLLAALPLPALAQPVAIKVDWNGNDAAGGVLVNRVRGLIAASPDKREAVDRRSGLAVILQTVDPAVEWKDGGTGLLQMTVYALTVNVRPAGGPDQFASSALGYCNFVDLAGCAREIVAVIDEEIANRGLR